MLPHSVHFVFLSATIPNAMEFAEWICKLHEQVNIIWVIPNSISWTIFLFSYFIFVQSPVTLFIPIFVQLHYNTICILMEEMVFIWYLTKRVYLMKNISRRSCHNCLKKSRGLIEITIWRFLIKEEVFVFFSFLFLFSFILFIYLFFCIEIVDF